MYDYSCGVGEEPVQVAPPQIAWFSGVGSALVSVQHMGTAPLQSLSLPLQASGAPGYMVATESSQSTAAG